MDEDASDSMVDPYSYTGIINMPLPFAALNSCSLLWVEDLAL